ncbi:MAG TPA: transglycosylase SLT domain-containing protein, partial [Bacteroidia bacterium]|nr:transglycosylase SLT domain-containing protein [Bacteroidia bacterium]
MKKIPYKYALVVCCFIYINAHAQSQSNDSYLKDSSAIIFPDDPIASMLDSLSRFMIFDKPAIKTKNKYDFSPEYVPNYPDSIYSLRLKKLDNASPFDLIYNNAVRNYIELYAVRKREMVQRMLGMSQLYFPIIEEILDRRKIPLELKYLAIVESALNPTARSRAGAVGLWQFMYGT